MSTKSFQSVPKWVKLSSNSWLLTPEYDPPTLVVEIGSSSLSDDLGRKRLLYEQSGVQEYWVNDLNVEEIIAFAIA